MRLSHVTRLLAAVVAVTLPGCSEAEAPAAERLIYTSKNNAPLDAARAEAMRTLPVFWGKFYARPPGTSDFALKVRMSTSAGGSEYIWGEPISRTKDVVVVRLMNVPADIPNVSLGSDVRALVSDIWDWAYFKGDKAYGHFTTRVLMADASPEQRAQTEALLAPTALETEAK
jgi:uncharacterized protein YegJ (DUF2314 family)